MNFRTELKISETMDLNPSAKIMTIGSCFAENLFDYYAKLGFHIYSNPFGTTYNPIAISKQIHDILAKKKYDKGSLSQNSIQFFSFDHDSSFSNADSEKCIKEINQRIKDAYDQIRDCNVLLLTLGTAFTFGLENHAPDFLNVVNNCHKVDGKNFQRNLVKSEIITKYLRAALDDIIAANENIKIILTVSPVRHLRDNFVENQVSKAQLISTCYDLTGHNIAYFPSYEIMMDDLRDYRFYEDDLVHPSKIAIDYIVEKFNQFLFSKQVFDYIFEAEKIQKRKNHRPILNDHSTIETFNAKTQNLEKILCEKYPWSRIR